jgi:uncharacterized protein YndB with AHSA1/START domain
MALNRRLVEATPDEVWAVLADGWLYPLWVVGATRLRDVTGGWPSKGAKIHHSVGVWPLMIDDESEVLEVDPGSRLRLRAAVWPLGEATVTLHLHPSGAHTEVVIEEDVSSGPGVLVPAPIRNQMLKVRNVETLKRLAYVAENRVRDSAQGS